MNSQKWVRATFVLDHQMVENLSYISERTGLSRSQFVRDLMAEPLADLAGSFRTVPANPTEADLRQLSLNMLDVIEERAGQPMATLLQFAGKSHLATARGDSEGGDA